MKNTKKHNKVYKYEEGMYKQINKPYVSTFVLWELN